jgi:uncharacterized protein (DUF58 family)
MKTDRLYAKRFEEETNLRCHIIIDNSIDALSQIEREPAVLRIKLVFSVLASAVLMNLLKKQRDAIGLCVFRYL